MNRHRIESKVERQILTALIMSKPFLASAAPVLDLQLVESDTFRQVAKWCLEYYQQYEQSPRQHIKSMFNSWSELPGQDETKVEAMQAFLEELEPQYETVEAELNLQYLLDTLGNFLSMRKMSKLKDDLEYALSEGSRETAENAVQGYHSVNLGDGVGIDVLNDRPAWQRAFADPLEPLIEFKGAAGKFLNKALTRDALIGIQGPEKRGKTWWCVEFILKALKSRRRVAMFQCGDLSEAQLLHRLGTRLTGAVGKEEDSHKMLVVPTALKWREGEEGQEQREETGKLRVDVEGDEIAPKGFLTYKRAVRACTKFLHNLALHRDEPLFMLSTHSNSSINVKGINGILERWEHEKGFIADVIVIDYADILAPEDKRLEGRDCVNETWKALRRLSQDRHCLVISPTQANAKAYEVDIQTMGNFSEDHRKNAHVTGMLGLNQNEKEKAAQVMRLNWLVLRESYFTPYHVLHVGQCLDLGRACCCSLL